MPTYVEPLSWQHGDEPTSDGLNILSENLEALAEDLAGQANHAGNSKNAGSHPVFTFSHQAPWLVYQSEGSDSTGTIIGMREEESLGTEVRLPYAPAGGYFNLDDNVPWLTIGKLYCVREVRFAQEVD